MNKNTKPSTCASKGHFWQATTSPLVMRCARPGCHSMQHCINGIWHETQPDQPKPPTPPVAQPVELWA